MRPTRANIRSLLRRTRTLTQRNYGAKTVNFLHQLNPILLGWAGRFRHLVASRIFKYIDHCIFRQLWRWARRRHNNKGHRWIKDRYFAPVGKDNWLLNAKQARTGNRLQTVAQFQMSSLSIRRYIKIRSQARYHDARYAEYFKQRRLRPRFRSHGRQRPSPRQLELPL